MSFLKHILLLTLLLVTGLLKAQNTEYGVALDTNFMLIGDQQHLIFRVKTDPGIRIVFPQLKDTVVSGVEIISGPERDSVQEKDGRWLFEEKYVITSFDTGVYMIPSLPITVEGNEYNNVLRTDPLGFYVSTFQVDAEKGNYDIVMPYTTPWTFAEILPYLLWVLLGVVVIGGIWWYIVRMRKNKPLFVAKKEEIPPYVKAIRSLDEIKGEKLWQTGHEKEYYTRLTDTVRQYLQGEFGIAAMEQTSVETLKELEKRKEIETKERARLAEMLTTADYVKFAKFTPLQDESARYLDVAYDFVNVTYRHVQAEIEEKQRLADEKRKQKEEEEKKKVVGEEHEEQKNNKK